jgi:hypothetical protein
MLKLPGKIGEVFTSTSSSAKCQCVPLNVTQSDGTQNCAAAFINSSTLNDSDVKKNRCTNNILESIYKKTGFSSNPSMTSGSLVSGITSGFGIGKSDTGSSDAGSSTGSSKGVFGSFSPFGKSGFTTMTLQKIYNNIDRFYLIAISILLVILLYKLL